MLSKAKTPVIALALASLFSGCSTGQVDQQQKANAVDPANASYSVMVDSGVMMSAQEAATAYCDTSTDMCVNPTKVEDKLTLSTMPNGDLAFDVMTNGFNGHSCGVQGVARKTGVTNVWQFAQNNDGAMCKVNITIKNGAVILKQDENSDCSSYCGMRANLNDSFPFSSMK